MSLPLPLFRVLPILTLTFLILYVLYKLLHTLLIRPHLAPLRLVPGPANPSLILGNLRQITTNDPGKTQEEWLAKFGHVVAFKGHLNSDRVITTDARAINHVLTHSHDYQKPDTTRRTLGQLTGDGILVTEGEQHRQQRRIMNPSFSPNSIRELTPIFFQKAQEMCAVWNKILQADPTTEQTGIDVFAWLGRATLDIIGLAGFGYKFDALNLDEETNELSAAFSTLFKFTEGINILAILQIFIPILRYIPTERSRNEQKAQGTMKRIGRELIHERREALLHGERNAHGADEKKTIPAGSRTGHDLLTVLIKANMDTDVPDSQRLTDDDVLAQIPTFLAAGHDTTSTETTWCLHALSNHPGVQAKLRAELQSVPTDSPSMDELMALPYLDAVVRETLRIHSAVPATIRVAMKDDVIPLDKPFVDLKGVERREIRVQKGDSFGLVIAIMNRSKEIWGEDSFEFNPERWFNLPEAVKDVPGVWGNVFTFLGGARSCIGYRFALVEMKALIFTLIRAFEFEPIYPASEVYGKTMIVMRPYIKSDAQNRAQLPMKVKPCVTLAA